MTKLKFNLLAGTTLVLKNIHMDGQMDGQMVWLLGAPPILVRLTRDQIGLQRRAKDSWSQLLFVSFSGHQSFMAPSCSVLHCPAACTCSNNIVDCRGKGLTEIPTNLPETITEMYVPRIPSYSLLPSDPSHDFLQENLSISKTNLIDQLRQMFLSKLC